jgi:hypothetical protein
MAVVVLVNLQWRACVPEHAREREDTIDHVLVHLVPFPRRQGRRAAVP